MTERALVLALALSTAASLLAAHRRRDLAPAALALLGCVALAALSYAVRGYPRAAVAVFAAWPAVVAGLLRERAQGAVERAPHHARPGRIDDVADLADGGSEDSAHAPTLRRLPSSVKAAAPFLLYAATLPLYARALAPWWPWPLRAPRLAVGALALLVAWRRERGLGPAGPWSPVERVGLLLAAGQAAGVLVDAWQPWEGMRAVSAGVYVGCAGIVVWAAWRKKS